MSARRLAYLDALGVDVWLSRSAPAPAGVSAAPRAQTAAQPRIAAGDVSDCDWETLQAKVAACQACELCETRTQTVFGVGHRSPRWLIVGEAPGAEEDRAGEPFVGRAGKLLDAMLLAAGYTREQVFIANILKCRPPGNRDPKIAEMESCTPYLERQIALLKPQLIVTVGRIATQRLLNTTAPLGKLRGQIHSYGDTHPIPVVATYHPAYLLRSPSYKRKAWEDLLFAHQATGEAVH